MAQGHQTTDSLRQKRHLRFTRDRSGTQLTNGKLTLHGSMAGSQGLSRRGTRGDD